MFNYREFLMRGFKNAIGKQPDYWIIFNANGYFEKGVLQENDLQEIFTLIEDKNTEQLQED